MSVYIEQHDKDSAMYEIYSVREGARIVWAVVHEDMLGYLDGDYNIEESGVELKGVSV